MDGKIVPEVVVVVVASACVGFVFFAGMRWSPRVAEARDAELNRMLAQAELDPPEPVRATLMEHAVRRQRWGAVGGGIGGGVMFALTMLAIAVSGDDQGLFGGSAGALCLAAGWFGMAVSQSLGALVWLRRAATGVRVSALMPHGLSEYLYPRQLAVEVGLAVVGWTSVVIGLGMLPASLGTGPGAPLVLAGALMGLTSTVAVVLQKRLLSAPLTAADSDDLIVADVVLARALQDLFAATMSTLGVATVLLVVAPLGSWWISGVQPPAGSWWVAGVYVAIMLVATAIVFPVRRRHGLTPIARQVMTAKGAA